MSDILHNTNKVYKPESIEEFKTWFYDKFKYDCNKYPNYYDTATQSLRQKFLSSPFWEEVNNQLSNINDRYYMEKGFQLLSSKEAPIIYIKSLDSLLIKAFRKNIINNPNFPNEPVKGWINQNNWFSAIHDILRTTIVVKYLDGVNFIINDLDKIAKKNDCVLTYSLEAREEGYYAAHVGIQIPLDLIDFDFNLRKETINVEIQITTELQGIIKNLLHKHYEENRKKNHPKETMWQWDYHCDEFASNYLGHIVHYVEGMIVEIRDKQLKKQ